MARYDYKAVTNNGEIITRSSNRTYEAVAVFAGEDGRARYWSFCGSRELAERARLPYNSSSPIVRTVYPVEVTRDRGAK